MNALVLALSFGGPTIEVQPNDNCAMFVGGVVADALKGHVPFFLTIINHDGEAVLAGAPATRAVNRSRWLPLLCAALKQQNEASKAAATTP